MTQLKKILDWYIEIEQPVRPAGGRPPMESRHCAESSLGTHCLRLDAKARTAVVPKGLDSFDGNDARFFLQLLPGPRDEDGLPESIRFWKYRIEASE